MVVGSTLRRLVQISIPLSGTQAKSLGLSFRRRFRRSKTTHTQISLSSEFLCSRPPINHDTDQSTRAEVLRRHSSPQGTLPAAAVWEQCAAKLP